MQKKLFSVFILVAMVLALLPMSMLAAPPAQGDLSGELKLAGSTSVQPLAELLAAAFMKDNPNVKVTVQGGGSGVGVTSVAEGTVDIGDVSRNLKDDERAKYPDLIANVIAIDGVAIVTSPDVKLSGLTVDQVRSIYTGQITNFKDVGGPDATIVVVTREEGSGTRDFFQEKVMGKEQIFEKALVQQSNGQVRTTVATTPNSIGFLSFGFLDGSTNPVPIDGVEPKVDNVRNNSYQLWRNFNMVTKGAPNPLAKAFLDFVFSDAGQVIVAKEWIPVVGGKTLMLPEPTPSDLSGTLKLAGSTSIQPLAEKLAADFMKYNPYGQQVIVEEGYITVAPS